MVCASQTTTRESAHAVQRCHQRRHRRGADGRSRLVRAGIASAATGLGTVAGGFLVNGRHLSFGDDPTTEMWVGGQLFNLNQYNAIPPGSIRVWLDYGNSPGYGSSVEAEIRELLTHVPVWDGQPGMLKASRTLNADQFFVHAHLDRPQTRSDVPLPLPLRGRWRGRNDAGRHLAYCADELVRAVHLHCIR